MQRPYMTDASIVLLGFPTDVNSSFLRGPAKAPAAIRHALMSSAGNSFSESGLDVRTPGLTSDGGDVTLQESDHDRHAIQSAISEQLRHGRRVISLGGDHSITYPIISSYAAVYPDLTIVQFDAHPDLYPSFQGNRYSHASPFARILEDTKVSRLLQIGIRTMTPEQQTVADRYDVRVFGPSQLETAHKSLPDGAVYVTLDLDSLDPAFALGVSHREPGGLSVRDILETVGRIPGKLVGADVVELNPDEDFRGMTATVGAKFVKELTARMVRDTSF